ncbi:hypothetical protein VYU27_007789 [Nannochloropsis oceanica]
MAYAQEAKGLVQERGRTPQHAAPRDKSRRWLMDYHSPKDVLPFAGRRHRQEVQEQRERRQGQASSGSGRGQRQTRSRTWGLLVEADAARDSSSTIRTSRRREGQKEGAVSETYLSEYQRSFLWPGELDDPGKKQGEDEGGVKMEERSGAASSSSSSSSSFSPSSSSSSSSSAVFSSLSNGTYASEEKAFYISDSDLSVASSPSLLSSIFHVGPHGGRVGGVDEWDEEEGEWEVNEEGEAEEEERGDEEREASSEGGGLGELTWWEVLGESPPQESEEEREGGKKETKVSYVSSGIADEQGCKRGGRRRYGGKGRQACLRDEMSQILIKERDPGADIWDVHMGSNGTLQRRPRWCVYGC